MFYAAWGWVLPNWNFHVCHWIASHFTPPYPLKLSRVCTKRHNGKIWSINLPQQVKFTWSDRPIAIAFHYTNLSISFHKLGQFNRYLFSLPDLILLCSRFTAQAPPFSLLSSPPLDESLVRAALAAPLKALKTSWSPISPRSDNDSSLSFYPFVDSFTWRLFISKV